jgi:hypothetical protein
MGVHVFPPSRLISMFTCSSSPRLCVHRIDLVDPTPQDTFVFGAVTVMAGAASANVTLLMSPSPGRMSAALRLRLGALRPSWP